jgi:glycine/D-amino acid oxidase-like deaminating enzyme
MALQPPPSAPPLRIKLYHTGRDGGISPKANGTVVVGATREFVGWDGRVTAGGVGFLVDQAQHFMPSLAQATIKHVWHGFRPMCLDGGPPLVGPLRGLDNVGIIAGHGSIGITLSAGVARLAAQWLQGHTPDLPLMPSGAGRNIVEAP